jgi:hypothetical protein
MIEILTGRLVEQNTYWLDKQLISDMEKQIADLKFQLSEKAIELQCKKKKIEETVNALKDLSLHSHSNEQVFLETF